MNSIEKLNQILAHVRACNIDIRFETLFGTGGGCCEIKSRRVLFIDLSLGASEQMEVLANDPVLCSILSDHSNGTNLLHDFKLKSAA